MKQHLLVMNWQKNISAAMIDKRVDLNESRGKSL